MSDIATGTGDRGDTALARGSRVRKDDARVEAYGTLDEAASAIGFARVAITAAPLDLLLAFAQHRLLALASLVAGASSVPAVNDADVHALERGLDDLERMADVTPGFVLPGGSEAAARLHLARTVVRRAERRLVALDTDSFGSGLRFVNRLSDVLYAAARFANADARVDEESWDAGFRPPED